MRTNGFTTIAASLCLFNLATASHADVTLVSRIGGSKTQSQHTPIAATRTITTYFKNGSARMETDADRTILLYNDKTRTVTVLNPTQKTYYEKTLPKPGSQPRLPGQFGQFVSVSTTGGVQESPSGRPQMVAGIATKPYTLMANIDIQPKNNTTGRSRSRATNTFQGMAVHVEGRFQGAAASSVIPSATAERIQFFTEQLTASGWVAGPVLSNFMTLKVVPMRGTVVITPSSNATGAGFATGTATMSMEVLSLDQQAVLEDALFAIPAGYRKVASPEQVTRGIAEMSGIIGKSGTSGRFKGMAKQETL